MHKILKDFLVQDWLNKNKKEEQLILIKAFRERGLEKSFNRHCSLLEAKAKADFDSLLCYEIKEEQEKNVSKEDVRNLGEHHFQEKNQFLDVFYITEKLKTNCVLFNQKNIVGGELDVESMEWLLKTIKDKEYDRYAVVDIYASIWKMLTEGADEDFKELKDKLKKENDTLDQEHKRHLFRYVQNYCIRGINNGHSEYFGELFDIYKYLLDSRIIFDEKEMLASSDFINMVTVALRMKEYNWAESFVEQNHIYLHEIEQQSVYHLNLAKIFYEKKNYKEALQRIQFHHFDDVYYDISARYLMIKIFFDEEEDETLSYAIRSLQLMLKRKKGISSFNKTSCLRFLKSLKYIVRLRDYLRRRDFEAAKKMMIKIEGEAEKGAFANKNWLFSKYNELKERVTT